MSRNSGRVFVQYTLPLLCALIPLGCGRSAQSAASNGDRAFAAAPAEVKETWKSARTALSSGDYAGAITNLQKLGGNTTLTPQQSKVVQETGMAVSDQMYDAANKGDAKAKAAIAQLRALTAR
jgi:outer membrane protein assembly factor BamD (BamD/ComL family)